MTHKEIIKNNVLIAGFMGYQNIKGPKEYPVYKIPQHAYEINEEGNTVTVDTFEANWDLCFHSSWDWLMPVVEKIENDTPISNYLYSASGYTVIINGKEIDIQADSRTIIVSIGYRGPKKKIEAVYNAVVQFIEWYNTPNK